MGKLMWDYGSGGLRLPSFKTTWQLNEVHFILFEDSDASSWTQIGLYPLKDKIHSDFIFKHNSGTVNNWTDNPILRHLIKIWYEVHNDLGLKLRLSPKTPLKQNKLIPIILSGMISAPVSLT